jgi:hypothetical protein
MLTKYVKSLTYAGQMPPLNPERINEVNEPCGQIPPLKGVRGMLFLTANKHTYSSFITFLLVKIMLIILFISLLIL